MKPRTKFLLSLLLCYGLFFAALAYASRDAVFRAFFLLLVFGAFLNMIPYLRRRSEEKLEHATGWRRRWLKADLFMLWLCGWCIAAMIAGGTAVAVFIMSKPSIGRAAIPVAILTGLAMVSGLAFFSDLVKLRPRAKDNTREP